MRVTLLSTALAVVPRIVLAQPQCTIPSALTPTAPPVVAVAAQDAPAVGPQISAPISAPRSGPADITLPAALRHVAEAGADVQARGEEHGLRAYLARSGQQFMFLHATPDGEAVLAGMVTELTPQQLLDAAGGQTKELGEMHGLRSLFVSDGNQFQVFYVTPDGDRVIGGAMWDATGRNLTRDAVSAIPGTIQVAPSSSRTPETAAAASNALSVMQSAAVGTVGDANAPKVWMFVDPLCPFSIKAMHDLDPFVARKQIQLAVVPISINDYENGGRSTSAALSLLSQSPEGLVSAWSSAKFDGPVSADATDRLRANSTLAAAVSLRGTPTLFWRKADGSEGRSDGTPADLPSFVAGLGQ